MDTFQSSTSLHVIVYIEVYFELSIHRFSFANVTLWLKRKRIIMVLLITNEWNYIFLVRKPADFSLLYMMYCLITCKFFLIIITIIVPVSLFCSKTFFSRDCPSFYLTSQDIKMLFSRAKQNLLKGRRK